ncbi:MAG TPA: hypothetical protein VFE16_09095 [Candidatus Cybelea sp.]|jgi:hypothetical protein|nr:hypothetical protein [Candidatus Cybelea sp.]
MKFLSRPLLTVALLGVVILPQVAHAQETPASPAPTATPQAAVTTQPTFMDRQYDGSTHVMVAPYVWGPTIRADYQFSVPRLDRSGAGAAAKKVVGSTVLVGPSDYLSKLNTAAMLAFDVRKGNVDVFGDGIYLNASTTATIATQLSALKGRVTIPVTFDASAHVTTAIWELAAGYAIAHGHNADLTAFVGLREFPINLDADYNATISKRNIVTPTGSISSSQSTNDVIVGLKGRAFINDHLYATYYGDVGNGTGNSTWEGYAGAGYAFDHGQTIIALWRALDYYSFPSGANVQRFDMSGPLLGYTFGL